jgi:hypothetical protein
VNHRETTWKNGWPLERVLFAMAGTVILLSLALAVMFSPWFLLLTAFVALNQLAYAALGACGTSLILQKITPLRPACEAEVEAGIEGGRA